MTTREQATLILIGLAVLACLLGKATRRSLGGVVLALVRPKIFAIILVFAGLLVGATWVVWRLGYWDDTLVGSVLLWFMFTGFRTLLNINDAGKEAHFFRERLVEVVSFSAFYELFLNVRTFSLWVELLLQVGLGLLVVIQVVADHEKGLEQTAKVLRFVTLAVVLWLIIATVTNLVDHREEIELHDVIALFLVPVWLTLVSVPFFYLVALASSYGQVFLRMRWGTGHDKRAPLRNRLGVMRELRGGLHDIAQFAGSHAQSAGGSEGFAASRAVVREFRERRAARIAKDAAAKQRLIDYTDVTGTDEDGAQLDRREFKETRDALRWIATCQMGWYQREEDGGRYRPDILTILNNDFSRQGLPPEHGITVRVRKDGQAWYAWRRTITGWVFAIGSSEEPPNQWLHDGADPPKGFPSQDDAWGTSMFDVNDANWW